MTHEAVTSLPGAEQLSEGRATWGMIGESLDHIAALLTKASATDADTLFGRSVAAGGEGPRTDDHATTALKAVDSARWIVRARLVGDHTKGAECASRGYKEAAECSRDARALAERHRQAVAAAASPREERFCWDDHNHALQAGTLADYAAEWEAGFRTGAGLPARRVMSRTGDRWPVIVQQVTDGKQLTGWRLSVFGQEVVVAATDWGSDGKSGD